MKTSIFDRELETIEISKLLKAHHPRAICVSGLSGVGKSALVNKCVQDLPTISFSFKESAGASSPFSSFIINTNRKYTDKLIEKYTHLKPKDIRFSAFGLSTSFEILPSSFDSLFFEYFFERLYRAGFRCFRIDNIELCRSEADIAALSIIGDLAEPHLKILFEIGTLTPLDRRLKHLPIRSEHRAVVYVEPFTQDKTIGLYRFIHDREPPHDIFRQSAGLPLAIEHQIEANPDDPSLEWIKERLEDVDPGAYSLAYALSNFDEPCAAQELESVHEGNFANSLLQLIRNRIVLEEPDGVRFSHPAFRHILRRASAGYLDKQFLTKLFSVRSTKPSRSVDDEISLVTIASGIDDEHLVKAKGFEALVRIYSSQNALQILYVCEILLKKAILSERQRRIAATIKVQALCQLNRIGEAKEVLEIETETFATDKRSCLLHAMTLTLCHDWAGSNTLISSSLPHLDSRSLIISLSIKISNDIPLEDSASALTAFEDAVALATLEGYDDLLIELCRLHARLSKTPELAIEKMRDFPC